MNIATINNQQLTMSSREIAELTEKEHKTVMRDIRVMLKDLGHGTDLYLGQYSSNNRMYDEYNLPKRETLLLVSGYMLHVRVKIVDRLEYLESKLSQPVQLPSNKELALMVIKAEEEKEKAMLEVDRLQGVCNTITAQFASGTTTTAFSKQLNGVNVQQVNNKLLAMGVLIKTVHGFEPASYYRDRYFKLSFHEYKDSEENDRQKSKITLTKQGAKWLYRAYLSNKLPMKKTWDGSFVHMVFED